MSAIPATVRTPTHSATQAPSTIRVWMYGIFLAVAVAAYGYIPPADNTENAGWNTWKPAAGYLWLNATQARQGVVWQPGLEHRNFKNVLAAAKEGTWTPRPGFRFETPSTLSQAIWAPGSAHPDFPNILADEKANQWKPEAGYAWVNQTTGDLRVAAIQPAEAANSETNSGPQESRATRFVIGFIKAILGDGLAKPSSDDGMIARNVGRPIAEALRNSGFRDMAQALGGR